jgi:1-acyl-sn-glycerol-3-phosphate acyltransferase
MRGGNARWRVEPVYRAAIRVGLALLGAARIDIRAEGIDHLPESGGAVLAITHFGYADFAFTQAVIWRQRRRVVRFLITATAFRHRLAGPALRSMHHVPVDRSAGAGAFAAARRAAKAGELVGVFPESYVSRSFTLKPLKPGAIRLAQDAGVPLLPVAVWGGQRIRTRGVTTRIRDYRGIPVHVRFGAPLPLEVGEDAGRATERLREALDRLLDEARRDYPTPDPATGVWWVPAHLGGSAPTPAEADRLDREALLERARARRGSRQPGLLPAPSPRPGRAPEQPPAVSPHDASDAADADPQEVPREETG